MRCTRSACMGRAAAASANAKTPWAVWTSSRAPSPRLSDASAAISPRARNWSTPCAPMLRALSSRRPCRRRSVPRPPPQSATSRHQAGSATRHQERAARVKAVLEAAGLPVMPSTTHIVPVLVGDPEKCKGAATCCFRNIASTSSRSTIRPSRAEWNGCASRRRPITTMRLVDALAEALVDVWERLGLTRGQKAAAAE